MMGRSQSPASARAVVSLSDLAAPQHCKTLLSGQSGVEVYLHLQGMKLAGAVEKFREQAQEQYRRAQEAKRKQHETKGTKPAVDLKGGKSV